MAAAVATDWVVDGASDVHRYRGKPYLRVARVRLASGGGTYPSGGVGVAPPPLGRLGLRKGIQFINVTNAAAAASGVTNNQIWGWNNTLRTLQAFGMHPTTSIVPATLVEAVSGTVIAGTVLYLEVHGY